MKQLTDKQKHFIDRNPDRLTPEQLSARLGLPAQTVEDYLAKRKPAARSRETLFRIWAVLMPALLFVLLELALRVFGYGPNLDIFETLQNDSRYWVTNSQVGRRYFFVKQVTPATSYDALLKVKPDNGYRVFVLGGSTTAGFPYYHNIAFSRSLATRLEDALPDRHVEVFNLAMPAVNSYTVLDLMDELVDYQPDAFLVYAGHNEFYGALGVSSTEALGKYRWFVNLYIRLQHSKVFYLFRTFIGWVKLKVMLGGDKAVPRNATLMERMVGRKQVPYRGHDYKIAERIFRDNLRDIVRIARKCHVPVVLSNLVSNIRDQAPFESVYAGGVPTDAWKAAFAKGDALRTQQNFRGALAAYRQAEEIDASVAILQYRLAQCLLALGERPAAYATFYRAKDLDALRFRASEDFNQTLAEVADETGASFLDMKAYFEAASPDSLIGNNLILEHLHPNARGYFLMARAFFDRMRSEHFWVQSWDSTAVKSDAEYWDELAATPVDFESARLKQEVLMAGWPFRQTFDPHVAESYKPQNKMQEVAYDLFRDKVSWEKAHVELADYYTRTRDLARVAAEYRALVRGTPYNVSPYLRLGLVYLEQQDFAAALDIFQKSLRIEESAIADKWIGSIYVNSGKAEMGLPYLRRALKMNANDPEAMFNTTVALARMGDFQQARTLCQTLMAAYPKHPGVARLWKQIKDK